MVSIKDMASGYVDQLKYRIQQAEKQLVELQQHLQECENEIMFGETNKKLSRFASPTDSTPPPDTFEEECCDQDECCNANEPLMEVPTQPLNLDDIDHFSSSSESRDSF